MSVQFTESDEGIDYRGESISSLARGFILLMALAMFVAPAFFLALVPWTEPSWATLLAALSIVAFVAMGTTFAWMGLLDAKQAFFDARARVLRMKLRGPLGRRELEWPFEAIESILVERFKSLEDPDTFSLRMLIRRRRRPYHLGVFGLESDADAWQARIQSLLSTDAGNR